MGGRVSWLIQSSRTWDAHASATATPHRGRRVMTHAIAPAMHAAPTLWLNPRWSPMSRSRSGATATTASTAAARQSRRGAAPHPTAIPASACPTGDGTVTYYVMQILHTAKVAD